MKVIPLRMVWKKTLLTLAYLLCCKTKEFNMQTSFRSIRKGDRLSVGITASYNLKSLTECGQHCLQDITCVSFNYRFTTNFDREINCQLTDKAEFSHKDGERGNKLWTLYRIVLPCSMVNLCQNGGKCIVDNLDLPRKFRCVCNSPYRGELCENDEAFLSCKDALQNNRDAKNGVYKIKTETEEGYTYTYCQMSPLPGCSGGGWTLAMKIDGGKDTFQYDSTYWSSKTSFNDRGGLTGFDNYETKLPTYWSTALQELCVGMKVENELNFISVSINTTSLYDLIANGAYRPTNIGREKWKSLIDGSSLQRKCNKEGFNSVGDKALWSKARIGIIGNNEMDCGNPDSFIGFGTGLTTKCQPGNARNACGNEAACNPDNGEVNIIAMGYIMVR